MPRRWWSPDAPSRCTARTKKRARQAVLEAARRVGGLVFQVEVNACARQAGQWQRNQVRVGTALVVGLNQCDGVVQPIL